MYLHIKRIRVETLTEEKGPEGCSGNTNRLKRHIPKAFVRPLCTVMPLFLRPSVLYAAHHVFPFTCPGLPLSITFPLQLLPRALCGHTTGGTSVVKLMQYPSTSHRQPRPSQHICPFKWNFLQTKSQLRVRLKWWDLVIFGPLGHTKMTEDGGCVKMKPFQKSSGVDIKAQRACCSVFSSQVLGVWKLNISDD